VDESNPKVRDNEKTKDSEYSALSTRPVNRSEVAVRFSLDVLLWEKEV
jgi:hypothetical protein